MEPGARALFDSIQAFRGLNPSIQLWPGHGAGSACGKALGAVPMSTVGYELSANRSIAAATDPDTFTAYILDGQPEPPLYFARMKRDNRGGPAFRRHADARLLPQSNRHLRRDRCRGARHALVGRIPPRASSRRVVHAAQLAVQHVAGCYVPRRCRSCCWSKSRGFERDRDLVHGLDHVVGYFTPDMFAAYAQGKTARRSQIEPAEVDRSVASGVLARRAAARAELVERGRIPGAHNIATRASSRASRKYRATSRSWCTAHRGRARAMRPAFSTASATA
jgi:hydroxyacylglutathione hydrolase